ncbi:hypothetical protein [Streptomyces cyaneus]|uniref:hypothetical protein n=1 Tax=Streptomyces cyaneus TaxID=1904 RepID=UPI000FF8B1FD|nr:hypothetical protein [Streptomyces cyaneus]
MVAGQFAAQLGDERRDRNDRQAVRIEQLVRLWLGCPGRDRLTNPCAPNSSEVQHPSRRYDRGHVLIVGAA